MRPALVRLVFVLLAAAGCAPSPCDAANADQADPALRTCVYAAALDPDAATTLDPADGAPVAMTVPASGRGPTTLPDGTALIGSDAGLRWAGGGGSPADSAVVAAVAVGETGYALGLTTGGRVLWRTAAGEPVAEVTVREGSNAMLGQPNRATHLALARDAAFLVGADAVHDVTVWEPTGAARWRASLADGLARGDGVRDVAVSPDGRHVAAATRYAVAVWDAASGAPVARWALPGPATVTGVVFGPDGAHVAVRTAGRRSERAPAVLVWRLPEP